MEKVIQAVKDFYDMKLLKNSDFENALKDCSKEELVEFIMAHQSRGCFKEIVHD